MQLLNSKRGVLELIIGRRRVKARVTCKSKNKVKNVQHFNPPFHNVVTIPIFAFIGKELLIKHAVLFDD